MQVVRAEAQLVSMWLTREWRSKTSGPYRWSSVRSPTSSLALQSLTSSNPKQKNDARKLWMVGTHINRSFINIFSCLFFPFVLSVFPVCFTCFFSFLSQNRGVSKSDTSLIADVSYKQHRKNLDSFLLHSFSVGYQIAYTDNFKLLKMILAEMEC